MSQIGEIHNYHEALARNLPKRLAELELEVTELEARKLDRLDLIRDYREMLSIAQRRAPVPPVSATPPGGSSPGSAQPK